MSENNQSQVISDFELLEEYFRIIVIEQNACYVEKPKPSRAIRFDYMTFYGMSYLTAGNEWDSNTNSECKSDQMCPGMDESKRLTNCVSCSYKIGHRF